MNPDSIFRWLFLAVLLPVTLLAQSRQDLRDATANAPKDLPWTDSSVKAKSVFNSGNGKIDPALLAIARDADTKGADDLETAAKGFSVSVNDGMISVTLIAEDAAGVARLRGEVSKRGGRVSATFKTQVFALLPPDQIASMGKVDELYAAIRPGKVYPDQDHIEAKGITLEDGVLKINADRLHKANIRGQGVKVGILDFGFEKYDELQTAGNVPVPAAAKPFTKTGRMDVNTEHGTACSEIVHAMAPDAKLYLAAVDGDPDQIIQAALWLKSQGVDIISFSGGWHYGPHNGTGLLDQLVEEITKDHKTLWVNAAGNEAEQHFRVDVPAGTSGWIHMTSDSIVMALAPHESEIRLLVNWDDWGDDPMHPSATQDIDAVLMRYDKTTQQSVQIAQSVTQQNGRMPPVEQIRVPAQRGEIYLLALRATNVTRPVRVHVFSNAQAEMQPFERTGSLGIPATSNAALSVGAVDVTNEKLEDFSSRGPTDDNRAKPDLSSFDNVSSAAYGKNGAVGRFFGTSAACPHVAGLAALLKSQQPASDSVALRSRIMSALRQPSASEPGFGAGLTDVALLGEVSGPQPGQPGDEPATPISGLLELPENLGGKVSTQVIEELRRKRAPQPFEVKVRLGRDGNPPEYRIGDDMRLGFSSAETSYCTLVNRDAAANYTVLPLENDRLEAGHRYVYPGTITVGEPTGSEEFLFICAKEKVDLNAWKKSSEEGRIAVDVAAYEVKQ